MIQISRLQRKKLDEVGLINYKKVGLHPQDPNLVVVNKEHLSRDKTYYVVETKEILLFLQMYDGLDLQRIRPDQLQILLDANLVNEEKIQRPGEYKPGATVFQDDGGQYRCKKITNYMLALGLWKNAKKPNTAQTN